MRRASPERVLSELPASLRPLVDAVLAEAERRELSVHLVGGPVRDFLLERPLRDVDLLVESEDPQAAEQLARGAAPPDTRVVAHARFQTARLETRAGSVDLAATRSETYDRPGALPKVRPGGLEEDLRRRDFTVNGLALPLTRAARRGRPTLIDVADGVRDLREGSLRIFHENSFRDDPTRALRAARLAVRLGFRLSRRSHAGLRAALREGAFGAVSGERFRAEVEKLFGDAALGLDPAHALRQLDGWHVLPALEPGLHLERDAVAPLRRLGRAVEAPPWPPRGPRPWRAGLMVWLAPLEAALRRRVLRRLALRGDPAREVAGFPTWRDARMRALARARGRGACDAALAGADEDALLALLVSAPPTARRRILRWAREDRFVTLPVDGDDLARLGLRGAAIGSALARLRAAFLDRGVRTRDEVLALAEELSRGRRPG